MVPVCRIEQSLLESYKDHLIPNILTPRLIRLTEKCRRSDYSVVQMVPNKKIAVSLCHSLFREQISLYGFVQLFILIWTFA